MDNFIVYWKMFMDNNLGILNNFAVIFFVTPSLIPYFKNEFLKDHKKMTVIFEWLCIVIGIIIIINITIFFVVRSHGG